MFICVITNLVVITFLINKYVNNNLNKYENDVLNVISERPEVLITQKITFFQIGIHVVTLILTNLIKFILILVKCEHKFNKFSASVPSNRFSYNTAFFV